MSERRIAIVGEMAPIHAPNNYNPFANCRSGERMARILGVDYPYEFLRKIERHNVLGSDWDGYGWHDKAARRNAEELKWLLRDGRDVLLLGARVKVAFGLQTFEFLSWVESPTMSARGDSRYFILPHPSSRNRMWNDPEMEETVREFLREMEVIE